MGASQSYGKVLNTKPEFVQNPDNAEVLKIFRDSKNGEWYTKNSNGIVSEFKPGQPYKKLVLTSTADGQIILENSIGDIVWSRVDLGIYRGTLIGAFKKDKSICKPFCSNFGSTGQASIFLPVFDTKFTQVGWVTAFFGGENNEDYIEINTFKTDFERIEWPDLFGASNFPIEVTVYN